MFKIKRKLAIFSVFTVTAISSSYACNPNADCTRRVGSYPCPTWKQPGRTCPMYLNDPVCDAQKVACRVSCSNINEDANKYIFSSSNKVELLTKSINERNAKIDKLVKKIEMAEQNINRERESLNVLESMTQQLKTLLNSQKEIDAYMLQIKLQDPNFLDNKQAIENLLLQDEVPESIKLFLSSYLSLREQNSNLDDLVLQAQSSSALNAVFSMIDKAKKSIQESNNNLLKTLSDDILELSTQSSDLKSELSDLEVEQQNIKNQEARKCAPLI